MIKTLTYKDREALVIYSTHYRCWYGKITKTKKAFFESVDESGLENAFRNTFYNYLYNPPTIDTIPQDNEFSLEYMLTQGKYAFKKVRNLPQEFIIQICRNGFYSAAFTSYIRENFEALICGNTEEVDNTFICKKLTYPTEAEARYVLKHIAKTEQEHKKPSRVYECEKCGGWHLTSMPYDKYKVKATH